MKSQSPCPHCEGTRALPHLSDADCFRAVDAEIVEAVKHLRVLTRRKGQLLRARIRSHQRAVAAGGHSRRSTKALAGMLGSRNRSAALRSRRLSRSK